MAGIEIRKKKAAGELGLLFGEVILRMLHLWPVGGDSGTLNQPAGMGGHQLANYEEVGKILAA